MVVQTVSERVIELVAEQKGVDEGSLAAPLYDAIDPDALNSLFRNTEGTVAFEYLDLVVTVDHEGTVETTSKSAE